jgi:hypothetical protein
MEPRNERQAKHDSSRRALEFDGRAQGGGRTRIDHQFGIRALHAQGLQFPDVLFDRGA